MKIVKNVFVIEDSKDYSPKGCGFEFTCGDSRVYISNEVIYALKNIMDFDNARTHGNLVKCNDIGAHCSKDCSHKNWHLWKDDCMLPCVYASGAVKCLKEGT